MAWRERVKRRVRVRGLCDQSSGLWGWSLSGHHKPARECRARILKPPADMPFGERQFTVEDVGGHRWTFSQSIADVGPEEWGCHGSDIQVKTERGVLGR